MIHISIDTNRSLPIYQQLAAQITADIQQGALPVGTKLPTVRTLAAENGLAVGTVRQAYDALVRQGYIVMNQGRGTFVRSAVPIHPGGLRGPGSRKEQALLAIDRALGEILDLGLSPREARIFFDLKLRELEGMGPVVKIGVTDCNPEALAEIKLQIAPLPKVEVFCYPLDDVLVSPAALPSNLDLVVTTATHAAQLTDVLGGAHPTAVVVMSLSLDTAAGLARLRSERKVGILCDSLRFSELIHRACDRYCDLDTPPQVILWGQQANLREALEGLDTLILPTAYKDLCPAPLLEELETYLEQNRSVIYHYEMDQGSLLSLTRQVQELLNAEVEEL